MDKAFYWQRFKKYLYHSKELGLRLDISRINFDDGFLVQMEPFMQKAYCEMEKLEAGAVANREEGRMVGHYWLRSPELAPSAELADAIKSTIGRIAQFAAAVRNGECRAYGDRIFRNFLLIGIGGSALGPQLTCDALAGRGLKPYFLDNIDPDGIDRVLASLGDGLAETLVLVISKSGGTIETSKGMEEVREVFAKKGLSFARNAVAVTMPDSKLALLAQEEEWLAIFPIWDWVGGRTSVTSAVGLLPAALCGIDIASFLQGARLMDEETRKRDTQTNPAALLALMWYYATEGRAGRDMIILPYKDRLQYLARYLQQLVMESLGKEYDRDGRRVNQGLSVYGNKGSTDQHAYVQQLLDGVNNSFVTFIEVLKSEREYDGLAPESITSGDYLHAFLWGTREALSERGRESLTITLEKLDAASLGALIALYERAVGLYASMINVNAYNQPGVELGKKGANMLIDMLTEVLAYLSSHRETAFSVCEIAEAVGRCGEEENVFLLLEYLAADGSRGVKKEAGEKFSCRYYLS